jgi:hypothetical protein
MSTTDDSQVKTSSVKYNRWGYGAFVMVSLYFLLVSEDLNSAVINLGIALVFDPFDQSVPLNKRPLYQRVWLIVHLVILLGLFGWMVAN